MPSDNGSGLFGRIKNVFSPKAASPEQTWTPRDPALYKIWSVLSDSGQEVNAKTAMTLDAVSACVKLVSQAIASLPLNLWQTTQDGRKIAQNHDLHPLLVTSPNSTTTAFDFWQAVVASLLLYGEAYVRKIVVDGRIQSLQFMHMSKLSISTDSKGLNVYRYSKTNGTSIEIPRAQVWKILGYSLDGENGVSAIEYGAQVFGTALAAEKQAARAFRNGTLQSIYYTIDRWLTDEQFDKYSKNIAGSVENGSTPLLEGGVDVKSLGLNPVDAQLLQSRNYSVESICRFFGVPPSMIGHSSAGTTSWGSGIESQQLGFLTMTLSPWLRRIEQSISLNLLSPTERKRYFPDFDVSALLRADSAARSSYYAQLVNNGLMTRDEARALEGLPKMGGNASVLTVQSAMVPLDSIEKQVSAGQAPVLDQTMPEGSNK